MRGAPDPEPHDLEGYAKRERRMAKKLLVFGGGFICLIVLGVLYWNWSAAREWQRLEADLEAKGETFDLQHLLPPAPPPADNFCSINALKDIVLVIDGDPDRGDPAARRRAFVSISSAATSKGVAKPALSTGPLNCDLSDIVEWAKFCRETGLLKMPLESGNPAADLLSALDAGIPAVRDLAQASVRPVAQFLPPLTERKWGPLFVSHPTPYLTNIQDATQLLRLRTVAAIHAHDGKVATESLIAMSRLAEAIGQEPFLLAHLVSLTLNSMMHNALWEALRLRVFNFERLHELTECLRRYDGRKLLLYAARTELLLTVNSTENLKAHPEHVAPLVPAMSSSLRLASLIPPGWFDQNTTRLVSLQWEHIIKPLKYDSLRSAVIGSGDLHTQLEKTHKSLPARFNHPLVHVVLPAWKTIIEKSAATQVNNDLALTAIALEAYFVRNQKYPVTLRELVPDFVPSPPHDGLDGSPLGYKQTPDGRFLLWAVGFDGIDDGGRLTPDPATGKPGSNMRRLEYKGDWVWRYSVGETK